MSPNDLVCSISNVWDAFPSFQTRSNPASNAKIRLRMGPSAENSGVYYDLSSLQGVNLGLLSAPKPAAHSNSTSVSRAPLATVTPFWNMFPPKNTSSIKFTGNELKQHSPEMALKEIARGDAPATAVQSHELWKHVHSSSATASPNTSPDLNLDCGVSAVAADAFYDSVNSQDDHWNGDNRRTKRMLEWACERQTKRRRANRGEEQPYSCDETTETVDSLQEPSRAGHFDDLASLLLSFAASEPVSCARLSARPAAVLPRDVVHGASLLMSFKNSSTKPQQLLCGQ